MELTTIAINGVAIEDYGIRPFNLSGWLASQVVSYLGTGGSSQIVGRTGVFASVQSAQWTPRPLKLVPQANGPDDATGRTQLRAFYAAMQGLLEIEIVDAPGRVCYGFWEADGTDTLAGIAFTGNVALRGAGQIICPDPTWYSRGAQLVSAAATVPIAVPAGTAIGRAEIRVVGAATDPTITLTNRQGIALGQMRFTVTLEDTDTLVIKPDADVPSIQVVTAGVGSDATGDLNPADTFLVLDPLDGPTLTTSDGTLVVTTWIGDLT